MWISGYDCLPFLPIYFCGCIKWYSSMVVNVAFLINDNHILYDHMDVYHSNMLGKSYFWSAGYSVVHAWITAIILYPCFINITGINIYVQGRILYGVVNHWGSGSPCITIVLCFIWHTPFIMSAHPAIFPLNQHLLFDTCQASYVALLVTECCNLIGRMVNPCLMLMLEFLEYVFCSHRVLHVLWL